MDNDKPWLKSYPPGIPADIDLDEYASVVEIFDEATSRFAGQPAFRNLGKTIDYATLARLSDAFASWLLHEAKLVKGDRIAIMMPNLLQYPVALFGALRAGLVVVNTNPLYTERELAYQLKDSGARAIVVVELFAATLEKVVAGTFVEHVIVTRVGDLLDFPKSFLVNSVMKYVKKMVPAYSLPGFHRFTDVIERGRDLPKANATLGHKDLALLQYTGGTTGVAKGAMLTHGNMVANTLQISAWHSPINLVEGEEIIVTALPLYHIFALTANCLTFMKLGALNLLITNPHDISAFIKELSKVRFNAFTGVNTLFVALMNDEQFRTLDFSGLKMTVGGGMAVQRVVADRWKAITENVLIEAYGLTEASPAACCNPMNMKAFNASIGLPIPSTEVTVRDPDNNAVAIGEPGELFIRGPQVMKGYWQRPDETAETIDSHGWLHTGDVATIDEHGFVKIVDRLKDMIIVSGFNVYPNEIESVIVELSGVLEVGAVGVPDEHSGEAVKAVVVRMDLALTEEAIKAHCKEYLTGYKRPKIVQFVDELPKTNVGKILRREHRDL